MASRLMLPLLPLALLGVIGGTAIQIHKSRTRTRLSPTTGSLGKFAGQLEKGQLYRVWLTLPSGYVSDLRRATDGQKALLADIRGRLESVGFAGTLLVTQDPTHGKTATVITRWNRPARELQRNPDPLTVTRIEAVEEPPTVATLPPTPPPACLDEGLVPGEVAAIRAALEGSIDTKHLGGFAATCEPYFPIAAGLLRAKASLLSARNAGSVIAGENRDRAAKVTEAFQGFCDGVGWDGKKAMAFAAQEQLPAHNLAILTSELGKGAATGFSQATGKLSKTWVPLSRLIGIEDAVATAQDFARAAEATEHAPAENGGVSVATVGGVPLEHVPQGIPFASTLKKAHPLLSLVPSPGTGVLPMMVAGAALSLVLPITLADMSNASATLPERLRPMFEIGRQAGWASVFQAGAPKTMGMLQSRNENLEPEEKIAFDLGLSLGRAAGLQKAGFRTFYLGTRGAGLGPRSGDFARAVTAGSKLGSQDYGTALALRRKEELEELATKMGVPLERVEGAVRECIVELLKTGAMARHGMLENALGVDPCIASAARAVIREVGDNVRVVDPKALKTMLPPRGNEHYVSPSALQLAHAGAKPFSSGVMSPEGIRERLLDIGRSITDDALAAKKELQKAQKTLERRRWVEWHRKQGQGPYRPGSTSGGSLTGKLEE